MTATKNEVILCCVWAGGQGFAPFTEGPHHSGGRFGRQYRHVHVVPIGQRGPRQFNEVHIYFLG
ncbi:MAG: hypothetical protein FWD06_09940 [Oscillospiraceae bacterium]|nr:hypothetical protein [Oscillospiraceae bacterium]